MFRNTMFLRFSHVRTSDAPSTLCFIIRRRGSAKGFMRSCRVSPICPTCPACFRQLPNSSQSSRTSKMAADNRLHTKKNPGGRTRRLTGKPSILFSKVKKPCRYQIGCNLKQNGHYSLLHINHLLSVLLRTLNYIFFISQKQIHQSTTIEQILDIFEFRKLSKIIFSRCQNLKQIPLEEIF